MLMLKKSCEEFLNELASSAPVPGGGAVSALGGALGAALGSMVGNLTVGKKKYENVQQDIEKLLVLLKDSQRQMIELAQADADAFMPLSKAYGLPSNTPEEKETKMNVMENALRGACAVPMEVLQECVFALGLLEEMGDKGTKIAISDVAVGAVFLRAAAQAAAMNIFTNTRLMQNKVYANQCEELADRMREEAMELADRLYLKVEEELR